MQGDTSMHRYSKIQAFKTLMSTSPPIKIEPIKYTPIEGEGKMTTIVNSIHAITFPYFTLEINDIYQDEGFEIMPTIEELTVLHFKLRSIKELPILLHTLPMTEERTEEILDAVKELNVGTVKYRNNGLWGKYIIVTPI
jgi:hypothetical protein